MIKLFGSQYFSCKFLLNLSSLYMEEKSYLSTRLKMLNIKRSLSFSANFLVFNVKICYILPLDQWNFDRRFINWRIQNHTLFKKFPFVLLNVFSFSNSISFTVQNNFNRVLKLMLTYKNLKIVL